MMLSKRTECDGDAMRKEWLVARELVVKEGVSGQVMSDRC